MCENQPKNKAHVADNPFRRLTQLAVELRTLALTAYAADTPPTTDETAAVAARLKQFAANCRVVARRLGCSADAVDVLVAAAVALWNARAEQRDPYSRANVLDTAVPAVVLLADDYDAERRVGGGPDGEPTAEPPLETLTPDQFAVLDALRNALPQRLLLEDLAAATRISRKTCAKIVAWLMERTPSLTDRASARSGVTITPAGVALLGRRATFP